MIEEIINVLAIAVVNSEETFLQTRIMMFHFTNIKGDIDYKMVTDIFVKQTTNGITAAQLTLINQMLSPHNSAEQH